MSKIPLNFVITPLYKGKGASWRSSLLYCEKGGAIFYILLAIVMLAMLTFAFTDGGSLNTSKQNAYKISEQLYTQFNNINAAVMGCILEYPEGGGDLNGDTNIDALDNPNRPYPLTPTNANNPGGAAANDQARNMKCPGSGSSIFQGSGTIGSYLSPPPAEFSEWEYFNVAGGAPNGGVYVRIIGGNNPTASEVVELLQLKFDSSQITIDHNSCGTNCIVIWIKRN